MQKLKILKAFDRFTGFDWDQGNIDKNWIKHGVSNRECEEVFSNQPLVVSDNFKHSQKEKRWAALGKTDRGRRLFQSFTVRDDKLRIISARDMNKNERRHYQKYEAT